MRSGDLTAVALAQSVLDQVDRVGGPLNAFITVRPPEEVLGEARDADRRRRHGEGHGPLDGIPVAVKDNVATAGLRTTAGSSFLSRWVPQADAAAVARLKAAGAILVGKTNMYEWAHSATDNPHYGVTPNPWDPARVTGGSSSGSASALAAEMCLGAVGTDSGGSIRIPAAFCGVVGLKPTFGSIPRDGVHPTSWSMDVVGPMARTVADTGLLFSVLSGADPQEAPAPDLAGMVIGVETSYFLRSMEPSTRDVFDAALESLTSRGARVESFELPILEASLAALLAIIFPESTSLHRARMQENLAGYGETVRRSLLAGLLYRAVDYVEAQRVRAIVTRQLTDVLDRVDVLVSPSMVLEAPEHGRREFVLDGQSYDALHTLIRCLIPFNLSGHPAVSVPYGYGPDGLPLGIQVAAAASQEATALRVAAALEEDFAPRRRRPPAATGGAGP
jgi:aspartyl-tRNA(Asn)/glutamyl-tRNA(Gln) amidotransferase subunit A